MRMMIISMRIKYCGCDKEPSQILLCAAKIMMRLACDAHDDNFEENKVLWL